MASRSKIVEAGASSLRFVPFWNLGELAKVPTPQGRSNPAYGAVYVGLWRDSEVSERDPRVRLLSYTGPVRHTCGPSKMTPSGHGGCAKILTASGYSRSTNTFL